MECVNWISSVCDQDTATLADLPLSVPENCFPFVNSFKRQYSGFVIGQRLMIIFIIGQSNNFFF